MTENLFIKHKNVDNKTINIVFGFIRRCQMLLPNNNPLYNIPSLVEHLCICYYWIREYFTSHGNIITLNENKNIAISKGDMWDTNTVYGNIDIDDKPKLYIWLIKLYSKTYSAYFGLDSSNKQFCNDDFSQYQHNCSEFYGKTERNENDVIKMELNVLNKTLVFYINDEYQGIVFDNINFKNKTYYFAVCLR